MIKTPMTSVATAAGALGGSDQALRNLEARLGQKRPVGVRTPVLSLEEAGKQQPVDPLIKAVYRGQFEPVHAHAHARAHACVHVRARARARTVRPEPAQRLASGVLL